MTMSSSQRKGTAKLGEDSTSWASEEHTGAQEEAVAYNLHVLHVFDQLQNGNCGALALCVLCLRLIPIETVGRQMPSDMDELVAVLRGGSSGGGFATDARVPRWWRRLRWRARVDGYDVRAGKRASAGSDAAADDGKASMLP